ncbi:hypothetical protein FRC12_023884 [Ceratobasidium sp. 428]|nr:hypothetical protein FRC12_023884 [Ceratobasidium sp. 428]
MGATFEDLVLIARYLPKLQFLVADVSDTGWPRDLEKYSITPSPSTLCLANEFIFSNQDGYDEEEEDEYTKDLIDLIARDLHALWPNGIICEDTHRIPKSPDFEYFNLLLSKLEALNPPGLKLPARELHELTWLYPVPY